LRSLDDAPERGASSTDLPGPGVFVLYAAPCRIIRGRAPGAALGLSQLDLGAHSRLHTAKILRLSEDLPIVVEIVDSREKIDAFMPVVDGAVGEGLAILERVTIRFYRSDQIPRTIRNQ
jgi:PII-like signaling protein